MNAAKIRHWWLSGGSEPSFDPVTDIPGVRFIYDGDSAVLSGSNIESITNQVTGQANAIKIADGSRPTIVLNDLNGHATLDFNGAQGLKINVTDISTIDMTWFVVFKADGTSGANRRPLLNCWAGSSAGFSVNIVNNTAEFFIRNTTSQAFTDTAGWHVIMVKAKNYGTSLSPRVFKIDNGAAVNSITSAFANLAFNMFIGTNNDQSLFFDGRIAEIIGVSDVVTEDVEQQVYAYFNEKYALSIPTAMPQYTFISGTLTYASTFDPAITNLNYVIAFSGKSFGRKAPILCLGHGYSNTTGEFTAAMYQRFANYQTGLYVAAYNMRQRDGAGGIRDSSGRELLDVIDGVLTSISRHPDLIDETKRWDDGYSGGGGNSVARASKIPTFFCGHCDFFGMTDYISSPTTSWHSEATPGGAVAQQLELDILGLAGRLPADYPGECQSRVHRIAAPTNYQGKIFVFHDEADTAVEVQQSIEMWKSYVDLGKTANISLNISGPSNAVRLPGTQYEYNVQNTDRYIHGGPDAVLYPGNVASEATWVPLIFTTPLPAFVPARTVRVTGYHLEYSGTTKKFQLFLGRTTADGKAMEATFAYDYTNNSYTLTPILTSTDTQLVYSFTDDLGRTASGTIVGNTPTAFTPV